VVTAVEVTPGLGVLAAGSDCVTGAAGSDCATGAAGAEFGWSPNAP